MAIDPIWLSNLALNIAQCEILFCFVFLRFGHVKQNILKSVCVFQALSLHTFVSAQVNEHKMWGWQDLSFEPSFS